MKKVILSGHSQGLGTGICHALLARGCQVLGLARRPLPIPPAHAAQLQQISLDLGDADALSQWLASGALAAFLDGASQSLLINNAGTVQPIGQAGQLNPAETVHALTLNLTAPLLLSNAFVAASTASPDRRILHISSGAGRSAYPGWSVYCAGKAALDRHAQALALEQHPRLRIASLAPGVIDTAMQNEIRACNPQDFPLRERFVALKSQGQLSPPEQAGSLTVDYLFSEQFGTPVLSDLREQKAATP